MLAVLAASSAFVQPATLNVARAASLTTLSEPTMGFFDNLQPKRSGAVGGKPAQAGPKVSPLSPGSNYPGTKNLQEQSYGFGAFRQKFQTREGKSAYGVPIFDKKGNVNPAYLAKERAEMAKKSKNNVKKKVTELRKKPLPAHIPLRRFHSCFYITLPSLENSTFN
mgnify:CR=1 FL=1